MNQSSLDARSTGPPRPPRPSPPTCNNARSLSEDQPSSRPPGPLAKEALVRLVSHTTSKIKSHPRSCNPTSCAEDVYRHRCAEQRAISVRSPRHPLQREIFSLLRAAAVPASRMELVWRYKSNRRWGCERLCDLSPERF